MWIIVRRIIIILHLKFLKFRTDDLHQERTTCPARTNIQSNWVSVSWTTQREQL